MYRTNRKRDCSALQLRRSIHTEYTDKQKETERARKTRYVHKEKRKGELSCRQAFSQVSDFTLWALVVLLNLIPFIRLVDWRWTPSILAQDAASPLVSPSSTIWLSFLLFFSVGNPIRCSLCCVYISNLYGTNACIIERRRRRNEGSDRDTVGLVVPSLDLSSTTSKDKMISVRAE